jgi:flagellar assembly protein FliH
MRMEPQRFAFDRIFHVAEDEEDTEAMSLEAAALRAELRAVRDERDGAVTIARAEGFDAGLDQARGEREVAVLSAVDALHAAIEALDLRFEEAERRLTAQATELAIAAAELVAGRALAIAPGATVDEAIGRVLRQVARGTELLVRVHPDLIADVEARLAVRQTYDRRRLHVNVVGDVTIAVGDGRIEWEQGGLTLDAADRRDQIMAELGALLAPDPASEVPTIQ